MKVFFGKFTSGLIFKPINYFSLAYFIIFTIPFVALCIININSQKGYKTRIYYSSLESIIIEFLLMLFILIDWKRRTD